MVPKSPQAKGKRFEYYVRDVLKAFGYKAERTPLSGALDSWPGDITSNFPFFIECKNTEKTTFLPWYKKSEDESAPRRPIVIWTKNGEDAYCFLRFDDLLRQLQGESQVLPIARPTKKQKTAPEDVAWQGSLSKFAMSHRKPQK